MSDEAASGETSGQLEKSDWKPMFLAAFRDEKSVVHACRAVAIGRSTVYRHRKEDAAFRAAWDDIVGEQNDELVASALKRAIEGWEEPVWYEGVECGTVTKFSNTLTIFMLKTRTKEYRQRKPDDSRDIQIDLGSLDTPDALKAAAITVACAIAAGEVSAAQGDTLLAAIEQVRKTFVTSEMAEQLREILKSQEVDDGE